MKIWQFYFDANQWYFSHQLCGGLQVKDYISLCCYQIPEIQTKIASEIKLNQPPTLSDFIYITIQYQQEYSSLTQNQLWKWFQE